MTRFILGLVRVAERHRALRRLRRLLLSSGVAHLSSKHVDELAGSSSSIEEWSAQSAAVGCFLAVHALARRANFPNRPKVICWFVAGTTTGT